MRGTQVITGVGTSSVQALPANPKRMSLTFCSHSNATLTYTFGIPAVAGSGIVLGSGQPPVTIRREEIGGLIEQPVNVIASAVSSFATILEGFT